MSAVIDAWKATANTATAKNTQLELTTARNIFTTTLNRIGLLEILLDCSISTGGFVHIDPQLGGLPTIIGNDERPVFLYEFVEALDDLVDYNSVKEEFPTLSFAQISGAIGFLRKVSQHNAKGLDIDALEDEEDANDEELTNALRDALNNGETSRVLNNG